MLRVILLNPLPLSLSLSLSELLTKILLIMSALMLDTGNKALLNALYSVSA